MANVGVDEGYFLPTMDSVKDFWRGVMRQKEGVESCITLCGRQRVGPSIFCDACRHEWYRNWRGDSRSPHEWALQQRIKRAAERVIWPTWA